MERFRHWRSGAFFALFGMLFQLAFAIGHVDGEGPAHRDGLLLSSIERVAAAVAGPSSHHDHEKHGGQLDACPVCCLNAVAGQATLPVLAQLAAAVVAFDVEWPAAAPDFQTAKTSQPYEIRGPPSPLSA